jgi:hypothetical protein
MAVPTRRRLCCFCRNARRGCRLCRKKALGWGKGEEEEEERDAVVVAAAIGTAGGGYPCRAAEAADTRTSSIIIIIDDGGVVPVVVVTVRPVLRLAGDDKEAGIGGLVLFVCAQPASRSVSSALAAASLPWGEARRGCRSQSDTLVLRLLDGVKEAEAIMANSPSCPRRRNFQVAEMRATDVIHGNPGTRAVEEFAAVSVLRIGEPAKLGIPMGWLAPSITSQSPSDRDPGRPETDNHLAPLLACNRLSLSIASWRCGVGSPRMLLLLRPQQLLLLPSVTAVPTTATTTKAQAHDAASRRSDGEGEAVARLQR